MNRTELKRTTRLKTVSDERRMRADEREAVRLFCIERDGGCVAAHLVPAVTCGGRLDPHEPQRGADKYDPDRVLTVCRMHHNWIGREPKLAREVGLAVHRWEEWSWERDWKGWGE